MDRVFVCKDPPIGRAHASVLVDDDGLAIVHRLLKGQIEIPADQLAGVVLEPGGENDGVILSRDVRRLDLVTDMYTPSNVVVVFGRPLRVTEFRYGAEKVLAITGRERKQGVEVDAIGVTVDDPNGLVSAITRLGVRAELTVTEAYVRLVGQAYGAAAADIRAARDRAKHRGRVLTPVFVALFIVLLAVQISVHDADLSHTGAVVVSSLGWAAAIAVFILANWSPTNPARTPMGVKRARTMFAMMLVGAGLMIISIATTGWLHTHLGVPRAISQGLAAGGPGGLFGAWAVRLSRAT